MAIDAIVLAAGRSRRYGRNNKLLARVDGRALLEHALAAATASRVRQVTVVTGYQRRRIESMVRRFCARRPSRRPRLVHNAHYHAGLAASLRTGLLALHSDCEGVVVCLGDMPGVTAHTINRLLRARTGQAQAVRAGYAGHHGHPVLLLRPLFEDVLAVRGDHGAGAILARLSAEQLLTVEGGAGAVADIDRPRDRYRLPL